ncbi:MAG: nucleotidyltransferase domain-containing protein [Candidatus Nanopelagicales bacterium]|nr:nucleotidyltransferase domain-containing protein [Candidatus Nanopelagicales bacterium]
MEKDPGRLLLEARRRAGLSQARLAARAATTQAMVARYESRAVSPTVSTLERLLRACGQQLVVDSRAVDHPALSGPIGTKAVRHRRDIRRLARAAGAARVRVFGSVARGMESSDSDLDLLVDFPVRERGLVPLARLADQVSEVIGAPVDVVAEDSLADQVAERALAEAVEL